MVSKIKSANILKVILAVQELLQGQRSIVKTGSNRLSD